jgi:hypothetical protein
MPTLAVEALMPWVEGDEAGVVGIRAGVLCRRWSWGCLNILAEVQRADRWPWGFQDQTLGKTPLQLS